jgi:hypothetical protein
MRCPNQGGYPLLAIPKARYVADIQDDSTTSIIASEFSKFYAKHRRTAK